MIERIEWNRRIDGLPSPFMRGKGERQLRVTIHSDNLVEISGDELAALETLREFGHLSEVRILEFAPGNFPHIEIGSPDLKGNHIPVQILSDNVLQLLTSVPFPQQWPTIAARLVGRATTDHPDTKAMQDLLILSQAHVSCRGDIFVTLSPLLMQHRNKTWLREANIRTPLEAAKIAGLFLRSHDIYTIEAGPKFKRNTDRGMFYWVLARHRLPGMWPYFSACLKAEKIRGDDIGQLGQSILVRSVRALEARDAIGVQFYIPQNNNTQDQMMYHFDYLTLVLAGALDAQAMVTNRAFKVMNKERYATFRLFDFREKLKQKISPELCEILSDKRFNNLLTLLYEPRNTIHRAALQSITFQDGSKPLQTLVQIPQPTGQALWTAAEQFGGAEKWGLVGQFGDVLIEPYSYAFTLVEECLKLIDAIATATDIKSLFPDNQSIPSFTTKVPNDSIFSRSERIALLG